MAVRRPVRGGVVDVVGVLGVVGSPAVVVVGAVADGPVGGVPVNVATPASSCPPWSRANGG
jgi:hypothetical protein